MIKKKKTVIVIFPLDQNGIIHYFLTVEHFCLSYVFLSSFALLGTGNFLIRPSYSITSVRTVIKFLHLRQNTHTIQLILFSDQCREREFHILRRLYNFSTLIMTQIQFPHLSHYTQFCPQKT